MNGEFRDIDDLVEAMRERGRTSEPLRLASFEETMATVQRLRRRRWLWRGAAALAAAGLAAVAGALLLPTDASPPAAGPATNRRAQERPQHPRTPELRRMQPFPDLVAFADQDAEVTFPSPKRVVLTAGTLALQYRATGGLVVETPTARVAITGTVLSVAVDAGGTTVEVLRGRVEVTRAGESIVVVEGQQLSPRTRLPEPLPQDRSETLAMLFPEERPCPAVAAGGPATPVAVIAPKDESPVSPSSPASGVAQHADSDSAPAEPPAPVRDPEEAYRLAEAALRERRYGEAREHLEAILATVAAGSSREETALVDLARTCQRLGDAECARAALVRYLDRHPNGALREQARIDLCRLLERSGPASGLAPCLREYLAEFPEGRNAAWARELLDVPPEGPPTGDGV